MVAEFEANLIRMRTREHMAVARARGRLRGKQLNLSAVQRKHLLSLYDAGDHPQAELADLFSVSRTTVYREIQRRSAATKPANGP
jgi:DNA invertase Pin-like site-specific DNA recombinase